MKMTEYWESRFKAEGAMWKFEPSDSAVFALDLFEANNCKTILIPGFGYGRNAKLFYDKGFTITGIEISESAIVTSRENGLDCIVHHGSVTSMPFDNEIFDGIFCYAMIHLLNKKERHTFLQSCYKQLKPGGLMIFTVVSKKHSLYGNGKRLSKDRFAIDKGLNVYFYDEVSVKKEFSGFGLTEFRDIAEPVKYSFGQDPLKCILIICKMS